MPRTAVDRDGRDVQITGLSGIAWLGEDRYAAIMDNSDKLILFSLALARDGKPQQPTDVEAITLAEWHDYEDVAVCPEPFQKRLAARRIKQGFSDPGRCLLVCEEDTPAIRAVSLADGSLLGVIPIPKEFQACRPNRGLESLDTEPDNLHIWTANEEALTADGPASSVNQGTVVRLARIAIPEPDQKGLDEPTQIAYAADSPHTFVRVFTGDLLSGVTAIKGLGDGHLLVLERSGCPGLPPFESRMYFVDWRDGTNVAGITGHLASHAEKHVTKRLLWKDQLGCNVEGFTIGPTIGHHARTLIAVSDNGGIGTPSQLITFTLEFETSTSRLPLLVGVVSIVAALLGFLIFSRSARCLTCSPLR